MTGFAAADFSHIRNASLGRFTLDRLMKILAALDGSIRVTVHEGPHQASEAAMPAGVASVTHNPGGVG